MAEVEWDEGAVDELLALNGPIAREVQRRSIKVERAAKRLSPVDTGRLRSSITRSDVQRRRRSLVVRIGTDVEYAKYVEFGTSKMSAKPYLRPALDAART